MIGLLVVISGPSSGAGKDSVARTLEKRGNFSRVVTYNTRDIRPGEIDGVDYHFVSRDEFLRKKKKGFFLETNEYLGNLYATPKDEVLRLLKLGKDILLRVEVNGAKAAKKAIPEALLIFITAPFKQMRQRLIKRAREDRQEIEEKLAFAKKEMKEKKHFDYVVVNKEGKLEKTVKEVQKIIQKEKKKREF
jgi:guanylate kinase